MVFPSKPCYSVKTTEFHVQMSKLMFGCNDVNTDKCYHVQHTVQKHALDWQSTAELIGHSFSVGEVEHLAL